LNYTSLINKASVLRLTVLLGLNSDPGRQWLQIPAFWKPARGTSTVGHELDWL